MNLPLRTLSSADKIVIAMLRSEKTPVRVIAKYFPVSERHIWRILGEFPVRFPEVDEAIYKYRQISAKINEVGQKEEEEEEEEEDEEASMDMGLPIFRESYAPDIEATSANRRLTSKINGLLGVIKRFKTMLAKDNLKINRLKALQANKSGAQKQALPLSMPTEMPVEQSENLILKEMEVLSVANPHARRYSDRFLRFAYNFITYSPAAYRFARKLLPLPSRSTVYSRFSEAVSRMKVNLTKLDETYNMLEAFVEARKPGAQKIICVLGVDAFAFRLFLRRTAEVHELRKQLTVEQLRMLKPLLEDKKLIALVENEVEEGKDSEWDDDDQLTVEDDETEQCDFEEHEEDGFTAEPSGDLTSTNREHETCAMQDRVSQLFAAYGSAFIYVLMPLNSDMPCMTIHLQPASTGSANQTTMDVLDILISKCEMYNIEVEYIAADGDGAWNHRFQAVFDIMQKIRFSTLEDFALDVHKECRKSKRPLPITDPLHYLKAARGRYVDKSIVISKGDCSVKTNCDRAEEVLQLGMAIRDKSKLGRMRDFYPLQLFTIQNVAKLLKKKLYADAFYLAPHALLLLVLRVPFFEKNFRLKLLNVCYLLFSEMYNDLLPDSESELSKIPQRRVRNCPVITFAETVSLKRILCTIVAIASALQLHSDELRTDALGTHIVEQKIGQGRQYSDSRWERMLSAFARNSLRSLLLELDSVEVSSEGRLKTAGCRLNSCADWQIENFDDSLFARVLFHSLTKAGRIESTFKDSFKQVTGWINLLVQVLEERQNEIGKVWMPNPAANSAILSRLVNSTLGAYGLE